MAKKGVISCPCAQLRCSTMTPGLSSPRSPTTANMISLYSEVSHHCRPAHFHGYDGLLSYNDSPACASSLSMLKYDPVVKKKVLFLEATKGGKAK
ncbi:hypothetical protein N7450_002825 [Penicillium hetheringtonii]|uniref:Uncharacterized protein n=1 Tax=Penicillium hetheringtonii TaxID=911720 RepID=A0AAD6GYI0_9EURO|nr:hypothetical protein N7450_002825 [Penicillium hetheringtonii]